MGKKKPHTEQRELGDKHGDRGKLAGRGEEGRSLLGEKKGGKGKNLQLKQERPMAQTNGKVVGGLGKEVLAKAKRATKK